MYNYYNENFEKGLQFQDFVINTLIKRQCLVLSPLMSNNAQVYVGETLQGFEIKYDARCTGDNKTQATNQLSIEIAEKQVKENEYYVPSGIYRDDNSWMYIQGNYQQFWIFSKKMLQVLHKTKNYKEASMPTIKKFYLPLDHADYYCAKKIII